MCGRFVSRTGAAIERYFNITARQFHLFESHNVAPGTDIPVIRALDGGRELVLMRWGLVPHWAKDVKIGYKMINARAETVRGKPAFREAFKARRCLIPADGFYEWRRDVEPRRPYYIYRQDAAPMAFAGLWERWRQGEQTLESCAIITTEANALMATLHNRMPVILEPEAFDQWLMGTAEQAAVLLKPYAAAEIEAHPISRRVNNPRNDGAELLEVAQG